MCGNWITDNGYGVDDHADEDKNEHEDNDNNDAKEGLFILIQLIRWNN